MKKLFAYLIFAVAMLFATSSCTPLAFGVYDQNDSYYIETSPYYHHQHYYVDSFYDRHSPHYQRQHAPHSALNQYSNHRR